eukprot:6173236-Pleurochrysis_carterae.AAC.1
MYIPNENAFFKNTLSPCSKVDRKHSSKSKRRTTSSRACRRSLLRSTARLRNHSRVTSTRCVLLDHCGLNLAAHILSEASRL